MFVTTETLLSQSLSFFNINLSPKYATYHGFYFVDYVLQLILVYNWTWKDCTGALGGEKKGFVLWISGVFSAASAAAHSAALVSNGSWCADIDFARACIPNGTRRGDGDVFLTISVNHCSAFGSGATVSIGTILCGDVGEIVAFVLIAAVVNRGCGDGVLGKVSAILVKVVPRLDGEYDEVKETKLLKRDGTSGGSDSIICCIGVAVPIGMEVFV